MTPDEHRARAQHLLAAAEDIEAPIRRTPEVRRRLIAEAQLHATLALGDRPLPSAEVLAQALFRWNTSSYPYFVIHGRSGELSYEDPYVPIARAVLAAIEAVVDDG